MSYKYLSWSPGIVYNNKDDVSDKFFIEILLLRVCFLDPLLSKGEYRLKLPPLLCRGMEIATDYVSSFGVCMLLALTDGWAQWMRECICGNDVGIVVDSIGRRSLRRRDSNAVHRR